MKEFAEESITTGKMASGNLILIGFMGTGKSAVAKYLSTIFSRQLVEMDDTIEERTCMNISDIFAKYGEERFRNMETELLKELQTRENLIISCGGGVALRNENVAEMKKNGYVVLLTARPETILERVRRDDSRPVLHGKKNLESITALMEKRQEKYENAADIVVNTDDKTIQAVCMEILKKTGELGETHV